MPSCRFFLSADHKVQIETLTQTIQAKLTRAGELGVEISIIQEDLADTQGDKLPLTTKTSATPTAMPSCRFLSSANKMQIETLAQTIQAKQKTAITAGLVWRH